MDKKKETFEEKLDELEKIVLEFEVEINKIPTIPKVRTDLRQT